MIGPNPVLTSFHDNLEHHGVEICARELLCLCEPFVVDQRVQMKLVGWAQ